LSATVGALAVGLALGCYPLLRAGTLAPLVGALATVAVMLLGTALLGLVGSLPWALGLLGLSYAIVDVSRGEPVAAAPFVGAGLLLTGELVYAARELARASDPKADRRLPWLAGITLAGLSAGFVTVEAIGVASPTGLSAEILAVAASASLLALPAALIRTRFGRGVNRDDAERTVRGRR
jgi:hypothetical protein